LDIDKLSTKEQDKIREKLQALPLSTKHSLCINAVYTGNCSWPKCEFLNGKINRRTDWCDNWVRDGFMSFLIFGRKRNAI